MLKSILITLSVLFLAIAPVYSQSTTINEQALSEAQAKMMADPAIMADIQAMVNDPEIMAIMSDPAFLQAVQARNGAAIEQNPRTQELMSNPKIKALIEKMQALE